MLYVPLEPGQYDIVATYVGSGAPSLKYRQRVRDWLHKLSPGEFPQESLSVKVRG
jgi:predicted ATP-dependent Lon-type protease